jgi:galactokinase
LSQRAEHRYAGVQCGIMDQFATMMGKAGHALLLDCRSLDYEYVPLELENHVFILCDTNVSHSLAASEYNTRRRECEEAVRVLQPAFPNLRALRDLTPVGLKAERHRLSEVLYRRAHHVITENERVQRAVATLRAGELSRLGEFLYQSHGSLQNDYEVSCPELDFLVDFTRDRDEVLGARMMGGGFGGSTLNLVEKEQAERFLEEIGAAYQKEMGREMGRYVVRIGAGTGIIS